jgi:hypothetical protein
MKAKIILSRDTIHFDFEQFTISEQIRLFKGAKFKVKGLESDMSNQTKLIIKL